MICHVPSDKHLDEMRRQAHCMRVGFSILNDAPSPEYPMLFAKTSTQTLRQIVAGCELRLQVAPIGKYALYALRVFDDRNSPFALWSLVEEEQELVALRKMLCDGCEFGLYLFNERALNIASVTANCLPTTDRDDVAAALQPRKMADAEAWIYSQLAAKGVLDQIQIHGWRPKKVVVDSAVVTNDTWDVESGFQVIGLGGVRELMPLAEKPTTHFEQLIEIIAVDPGSHDVYRSPERVRDGEELCDVLLVGRTWAVVIQAKAWDVVHEGSIADRARLLRRGRRNVDDAVRQIKGAVRVMRKSEAIRDSEGQAINLDAVKSIFGLALVHDLSVFSEDETYGGAFVTEVHALHDLQLQLVDSVELQRIMTAKVLFDAHGNDWLPAVLHARWRRVSQLSTPYCYI